MNGHPDSPAVNRIGDGRESEAGDRGTDGPPAVEHAEAADDPDTQRLVSLTRRHRLFLAILDNMVWVILGICVIGFSVLIDGFGSVDNFINILYHSVFLATLAIPVTYVMIAGHLDLSVGSVAGLGAMLAAWLAGTSPSASGLNLDPFLVLGLVLLIGGGVGFVNGTFITRLRVNSFLMTLSTLIIVAGITLFITEGKGVSSLPDAFRLVDTIRPLDIPLMVFLVAFLYGAFHFILQVTQFGRHVYLVGGNPIAAFNFGIHVDGVVLRVFVFSGAMAGLTGWLLAARLNGATPSVATNLLFDVIAAAVIGGVSLSGGVGSLTGVIGGVLLLGAVASALDILVVSPFLVQVLRGSLVLGAITLDSIKRRYR
jgi:ribose transport system permease protein